MLAHFYRGFAELDARQHPLAWRDPDITWLLKHLGASTALPRLQRNHTRTRAYARAIAEWFDALKVIRFLNAARRFHPDEPVRPRLATLLGTSSATPTDQLIEQLERARRPSQHGLSVWLASQFASELTHTPEN